MQQQLSFGEFIKLRYGPKWVYAARASDRIKRQYPEAVVITPKQQRQLQTDYAKKWGREHDPVFWQMLCALRDLIAMHRTQGNSHGLATPANIEATYQAAEYALEEATSGKRF